MSVTRETVLARLAGLAGPDGATPLPASGALSEIIIHNGKVYFSIGVDPARAQAMEGLRRQAEEAVKGIPGVAGATVSLTAEAPKGGAAKAPSPGAQGGPAIQGAGAGRSGQGRALPGVRHIIAVASGKGGVGKSTTACNLALALKALGLRVGVLDADIYGPSMPKLFALKGRPRLKTGRVLEPLDGYGVAVMSIGFLVDEETPMIWRGPMVISAITQMLREVDWGELDVLVVDMPPGTGDAQLTMAQQVPLSGAVIVSTPQDLALLDARRGVAMFQKVDVPILGIVENMSYFVCPNCGTRHDIFAHGGARHEAERVGVPFLGEVPLTMEIREKADAGMPVQVVDPDGIHARTYREIADKVWRQLATGVAGKPAPRIVIE
ncbi:Mrp/NBP35 family ATP-binding protein [Prosthecomicrobium sp. N25]|uniref:Mrp/NBP35 family ATP-binding protein n=1 Tax=Prosthecomicrobium sp. N25 TaxID=3129254 RepID=UPI0030778C67